MRARFNVGDFVEIHVNTPLEVCQQRDPKGLYEKVARGELGRKTGQGFHTWS